MRLTNASTMYYWFYDIKENLQKYEEHVYKSHHIPGITFKLYNDKEQNHYYLFAIRDRWPVAFLETTHKMNCKGLPFPMVDAFFCKKEETKLEETIAFRMYKLIILFFGGIISEYCWNWGGASYRVMPGQGGYKALKRYRKYTKHFHGYYMFVEHQGNDIEWACEVMEVKHGPDIIFNKNMLSECLFVLTADEFIPNDTGVYKVHAPTFKGLFRTYYYTCGL